MNSLAAVSRQIFPVPGGSWSASGVRNSGASLVSIALQALASLVRSAFSVVGKVGSLIWKIGERAVMSFPKAIVFVTGHLAHGVRVGAQHHQIALLALAAIGVLALSVRLKIATTVLKGVGKMVQVTLKTLTSLAARSLKPIMRACIKVVKWVAKSLRKLLRHGAKALRRIGSFMWRLRKPILIVKKLVTGLVKPVFKYLAIRLGGLTLLSTFAWTLAFSTPHFLSILFISIGARIVGDGIAYAVRYGSYSAEFQQPIPGYVQSRVERRFPLRSLCLIDHSRPTFGKTVMTTAVTCLAIKALQSLAIPQISLVAIPLILGCQIATLSLASGFGFLRDVGLWSPLRFPR